ncbi:MAG: rhodanese-like domain-containing protein [Rhodospirillales bacterium]|nr:rhodanese-like domain-containing protein [Rhodospirillales bacterium]
MTPLDPIDISPQTAWTILERVPQALLIDVRTEPEWLFVGVPDPESLGKALIKICWQAYPSMERNSSFLDQLAASVLAPEQTLLLICRSGVRSKAAALFLRDNGYPAAFNIEGGFEGNLDGSKHRGVGGWKSASLPWKQG